MRVADQAITGALPRPHASSASKGWRGVLLEFFSGTDADFSAVFPNHGITVHLNGCMDLYQWYEGKAARTQMRRGNLIITPAGVPKKFQHKAGGDFLVVHIAPELLQRVAEQAGQPGAANVELVHSFCTRDAQIERLALQLWAEYRTDDLSSGICAEALASQMAVHLLRRHSTAARRPEPLPSKLSPRVLQRAIDYIEANLPGDLSIEDIAKALSMSAGHFARSFRNTTGVAPHSYVLERRIELAKSLLRETELPVSMIAARAGFSTLSHFCASFHKQAAATPGAFRRARSKMS